MPICGASPTLGMLLTHCLCVVSSTYTVEATCGEGVTVRNERSNSWLARLLVFCSHHSCHEDDAIFRIRGVK